jgi:putative intracellular protease/amidase
MAKIFIPLPDCDFDVTEVAVPWKIFKDAGHHIVFGTEHGGAPPACDPLLLTGVLFGQLGAEPEPKSFYAQLERDAAFLTPIRFSDFRTEDYAAIVLPGGHAPGMRQYLANATLQNNVAAFAATGKPWGAICHGVLVAARAKKADGSSVLAGRKTTCLPFYMERIAYFLTAWKLGKYYRTYDLYVEEEVKASLANKADFVRGPLSLIARGTRANHAAAFTVEDGNYVSARWPGDAYLFAEQMLQRL